MNQELLAPSYLTNMPLGGLYCHGRFQATKKSCHTPLPSHRDVRLVPHLFKRAGGFSLLSLSFIVVSILLATTVSSQQDGANTPRYNTQLGIGDQSPCRIDIDPRTSMRRGEGDWAILRRICWSRSQPYSRCWIMPYYHLSSVFCAFFIRCGQGQGRQPVSSSH